MRTSADRRWKGQAIAMARALLVAGLASACRGTEIEDLIGKINWLSNMRDQPAVEPFEEITVPDTLADVVNISREPPEGSVSVGAGVPLMAGPDDYAGIANPMEPTAESIARGQELYNIFCYVCHGAEGRGGGPVEGPFPAALINRLDTPHARGLSDGYIFGKISASRRPMPQYRRIPQEDRWHIVNYVRELQNR